MKKYQNNKLVIMVIILMILLIIILLSIFYSKNYSTFKNNRNNGNNAIFLQTKEPVDIEYWINHHLKMGITKLYIFVEDTPQIEPILKKYGNSIKYEMQNVNGESWGSDLDNRKAKNFQKILPDAQNNNINWIFKLDDDELLHTKNKKDLSKYLETVPNEVSRLIIRNYEAFYPYVNKNDKCFISSKFINCKQNPHLCMAYNNGKPAGRISDLGLELNGPHRLLGNGKEKELDSEDIIILHFESCNYPKWKTKFKRLNNDKDKSIIYDEKYKNNEEYVKNKFPYYYNSMNLVSSGASEKEQNDYYNNIKVKPYYNNNNCINIAFN